MKLSLLSRFKRGRTVIIRDPVEPAGEMAAAQRTHRELVERADRAVEMAFRHAEEAAELSGRTPPARPQPSGFPAKEVT